jgi:hypothetical protein
MHVLAVAGALIYEQGLLSAHQVLLAQCYWLSDTGTG